MDEPEILELLSKTKLLKKNDKFEWMNHYYFHSGDKSKDIYFGNLSFMVRLVDAHNNDESTTYDINGESSDYNGSKIMSLFQQGSEMLRSQKPLLSCTSTFLQDADSFKTMDKMVEKSEKVLCLVKEGEASLDYLSDDEKIRLSVKLGWDVSDKENQFYTFLNSKLLFSLLKVSEIIEGEDKCKWLFFDDPLPNLILGRKIQIISTYGKPVPKYFEEYTKRRKTKTTQS